MKKPARWNQKDKLVAAIRKVWRYSPMRKEALERTKVGVKANRCENCEEIFNIKLVEVHHTKSMHGWKTYDELIDKMLCHSTELKVLCERCHRYENAKQKIEAVGISKKARKEFS
jgi:hypothetical protein